MPGAYLFSLRPPDYSPAGRGLLSEPAGVSLSPAFALSGSCGLWSARHCARQAEQLPRGIVLEPVETLIRETAGFIEQLARETYARGAEFDDEELERRFLDFFDRLVQEERCGGCPTPIRRWAARFSARAAGCVPDDGRGASGALECSVCGERVVRVYSQ